MEPVVRAGDRLSVFYNCSSAPTALNIVAHTKNDDGSRSQVSMQITGATADRVAYNVTGGYFPKNGVIVAMTAYGDFSTIKRGQFYAQIRLDPITNEPMLLAKGYIYNQNGLSLGEFVEPGPGGGEGYFAIETLAGDIAPVDITKVLAATNAFRRISGFSLYYNASGDAGDRTIWAVLKKRLGAVPTGMVTSGSDYQWQSATVTLSASQEGGIHCVAEDAPAFVSFNDNATMTYANNGSAPAPFPLFATEGDTAELFIDVTNANANDRWTVYLFYEEWLKV